MLRGSGSQGRANDPSVILFHIPSSHRWTGRKQAMRELFSSLPVCVLRVRASMSVVQKAGCHDPYKCGSCDAKLSHRCGWSCCWELSCRLNSPTCKEHRPKAAMPATHGTWSSEGPQRSLFSSHLLPLGPQPELPCLNWGFTANHGFLRRLVLSCRSESATGV